MDSDLYEGDMEQEDRRLFTRHKDSVLCCSIDSNGSFAISGGIDDTAFVWDLDTKHVIFECLGHKESVVTAAFSKNSTYVATGDLNGYIQVRNCETGMKVFDFDIDEINWMLWHNKTEYVLLAGTKKGDFWAWNVYDPNAIKAFPSYGHSTTGAKLLSDGIRIIVTYADGSIRAFDLKTKQSIFQLTDPTESEIICMDLNPDETLLAVGCLNSTVKLITISNFKVIGTLLCKSAEKQKVGESTDDDRKMDTTNQPEPGTSVDVAEDRDDGDEGGTSVANSEAIEVVDEYSTDMKASDENEVCDNDDCDDRDEDDDNISIDDEANSIESVESALFSPCGRLLAAATNVGSISIWDVATQTTRCQLHSGIGISRCAWTEDGHYITGCLDGIVRIYDNNLNKVRETSMHLDQILDVAYRAGVLVTASEDKTCRVLRLSDS